MNKKELYILSIVIFMSIVAWIIIEVYRTGNKDKIEKQLQEVPAPKKKIDPKIFDILEKKEI